MKLPRLWSSGIPGDIRQGELRLQLSTDPPAHLALPTDVIVPLFHAVIGLF
jgi:hypothetical protein